MNESLKILKKIHISQAAQQNLEYVDKRRRGEIASLQSKFPRVNGRLMGGWELNTITCISAPSGGGKSALAKCLRDSFYELNKDMFKMKQYCMNFEMISHQQLARSATSEARITLRDLYSIDEPLTDEQFEKLKYYYAELSKRDCYFIDLSDTADNIAGSLYQYWLTECKPVGAVMYYEIDHALLTLGRQGQSEKERIDDLMNALIKLKKRIDTEGGMSVGIVLSQMNREIKKIERIKTPELHRPNTSDLFGALAFEIH